MRSMVQAAVALNQACVDTAPVQQRATILSQKDCPYAACYCEENAYRLCITLIQSGQVASLTELSVVFISNAAQHVAVWRQRAGRGSDGQAQWDYHVLIIQQQQQPIAASERVSPAPVDKKLATGDSVDCVISVDALPPAMAMAGWQQQERRRCRAGRYSGDHYPSSSSDSSSTDSSIGSGQNNNGSVRKRPATVNSSGGASGSRAGIVWDLDTTMPFPCDFDTYAAVALNMKHPLAQAWPRQYRVIPATLFVRHFASDRRHMVRPDGGWLTPPPPWPPIVAADGSGATDRLPLFRDFGRLQKGSETGSRCEVDEKSSEPWLGQVLSETQFRSRFGGH